MGFIAPIKRNNILQGVPANFGDPTQPSAGSQPVRS